MRDVKFSQNLGRLATLTTNGCVQFWDPHCTFERNVSPISSHPFIVALFCAAEHQPDQTSCLQGVTRDLHRSRGERRRSFVVIVEVTRAWL